MSWNGIFMDGVWWIGMDWSGTWKGLVIKIDIVYIYMYDRSFLIEWTWLVDGQCINPWDL